MSRSSNVPLLIRALILALMLGGAVGTVTSFLLVHRAWPWTMPDLAFRFLAGAAAAYAVGGLLTLTRDGWRESELIAWTVVAYGVPLGLAILIDRGLIDWSRPIAWGFLALVIPALLISLYYLVRNRDLARGGTGERIAPGLSRFLLALGTLALVLGLIVFIAPKHAGFVWPWAGLKAWKVLDSRLVASMLITIGAAALAVVWRADRGAAQVLLAMLWAYGIVAGAGLAIHAARTPAMRRDDLIYIVIFAVALALSAFFYLAGERREAPALAPQ